MHSILLKQASDSNKKARQLQEKLETLDSEHQQTQSDLKQALLVGSPENVQKMQDMEQQLSLIKEERTELYRKQADCTSRILTLLDSEKALKDQLLKIKLENDQLKQQVDKLLLSGSDQQNLLKEKDNVIQILRDELQMHQLELSKKEEKNIELQAQVDILQGENKQLLDRWIQQKQQEASKMNEANEFVETTLKTKRTTALGFIGKLASSVYRPSSAESTEPEPVQVASSACAVPENIKKRLLVHSDEINVMTVSSSGQLVATGSNDRKVLLLETATGSVKQTLTGANQGIMSIDFNNSDSMLVAGSNDYVVRLWQTSSGKQVNTLTGHIGKVFATKFVDNNQIISASHDRTIKVWDISKGYCTKTIFTMSSCNDACIVDFYGFTVASGHLDNSIRLWDCRSGSSIQELTELHSGQVTSLKMSPSKTMLLSTSRDNTLKLIDTRTWQPLQTLSDPQFRVGMNWSESTWSPDGVFVASGSQNGQVFIWNAHTGKKIGSLSGHKSAVCSVQWSPLGGSFVFSAEKEKMLLCWD